LCKAKKSGGYGFDAHWSDDFHHAVHTTLTSERNGYYQDYQGLKDVAKALSQGFVYDGCYSKFRQKEHGTDSKKLNPATFVVCTQNHDQVGNRALGDRLSQQLSFQGQKASAALLLLSPYLPLIFMGQEFGETAPFQYFIDHGDSSLVEAVRKGRRHEFREFNWKGEPPDPYAQNTFDRCNLQWYLTEEGRHRQLLNLYRDLIVLRKKWKLSEKITRSQIRVHYQEKQSWLGLEYRLRNRQRFGILYSFAGETLRLNLPFKSRSFTEILNTEALKYGGSLKKKSGRYTKDLTLQPQSAIAGRIQF